MTPTILLILLVLSSSSLAADLFTFVSDPPVDGDKIKACQAKDVLSCSVIEVSL
jgi:hypothetical protein